MAKTRLAKKRRLLRAHAHQEKTRTHAPYDAVEDRIERSQRLAWGKHNEPPLPALEEERDHGQLINGQHRLKTVLEALPPSRSTCPVCSTRQKVRKDGTFGKHRTTLASDPLEAVDCAGIGQPWNAIGHDGGAI